MRKVAVTSNPDANFRRVMIYDPANGSRVFVFLFRSIEDQPCDADYWYEDIAGAEQHAASEFGVDSIDWQFIPDPESGCGHDRLATQS